MIFIDEIDAISKTRTGGAASQAAENTLNALLTEMDGFTSPSPERPVFVLAATNFSLEDEEHATQSRASRTLDPALVRRFARAILVDLPDRAAREKYLFLRVADRPGCQVDPQFLRLIAERSAGMSIAISRPSLETAARGVKADGSLTGKLLEEAFEMVRSASPAPAIRRPYGEPPRMSGPYHSVLERRLVARLRHRRLTRRTWRIHGPIGRRGRTALANQGRSVGASA